MDYRSSGVDIDAGNQVVERIKALARSTHTPGVLAGVGAFGGLFRLGDTTGRDVVLVASADGVGTKLKVAFMAGVHDTVGEDLVNHCVNDILVQGAEPLFFLDYLATGRLAPDVAAGIVEGVARGCLANGCALLGGETAEMPGFYADGEYDLAGFIVGLVERSRIIDGSGLVPGDVLIGLPASGLHTNGYSLARRILFDHLRLDVGSHLPELGATVGDALLAPHRSYLGDVTPLLSAGRLKGMAHITGGGLTENVPRMLPAGSAARIDVRTWEVPAIFCYLQRAGKVPPAEMYRTFNMGIGLVLACAEEDVDHVLRSLPREDGAGRAVIGRVSDGDRQVVYDGL